MKRQYLSDKEIEDISMLVGSGKVVDTVNCVKRIIKNRSSGLDKCARPLDYRGRFSEENCFAIGYLKIIEEYIQEQSQRQTKEELVESTVFYIGMLIKEIQNFWGSNG